MANSHLYLFDLFCMTRKSWESYSAVQPNLNSRMFLLQLFGMIANSQVFLDATIITFLNKTDLFAELCKRSDFLVHNQNCIRQEQSHFYSAVKTFHLIKNVPSCKGILNHFFKHEVPPIIYIVSTLHRHIYNHADCISCLTIWLKSYLCQVRGLVSLSLELPEILIFL